MPVVVPEDTGVPILDFGRWDDEGGVDALATEMKPAIEDGGLIYVVNFGISSARVERQWSLARQVFDQPKDQLEGHIADLANGDYSGYRPLGLIEQHPGLRDNFESYNMYKLNARREQDRPHVDLIRKNYAEIEAFQRDSHELIASRVLRLLAHLLDISPNVFLDKHQWQDDCSSFLRYLKYHPRSTEKNREYNNIYTRAHTDFGSVTVLFSNAVSGLEIQTRDEQWHPIDHVSGGAVVSFADILSIWCKSYVRSCMHRVVAPPLHQQHLERFSLIYFLRPGNGTKLEPLRSSVLSSTGLAEQPDDHELQQKLQLTVGEWVKRHTTSKARKKDSAPQSKETFESFFRKKIEA